MTFRIAVLFLGAGIVSASCGQSASQGGGDAGSSAAAGSGGSSSVSGGSGGGTSSMGGNASGGGGDPSGGAGAQGDAGKPSGSAGKPGGSGGRDGGGTGGSTGKGGAGGSAKGSGGSTGTGGKAGTAGAGGKGETGGTADTDGGTDTGCLVFKTPTKIGDFENSALKGPSGIVASRAHPGVLYAHLDTGGTATVYASTLAGKNLGEYTVTGATNTDWEDFAVGKGPGDGSYLYIGDVGDNAARTGGTVRNEIQVYRVPEPNVSTTQAVVREALSGAEVLRFTYPDKAHDTESLMVDPVSGDLILITKETDGNSIVYRAAGNTPVDTPTVLEKVTTVQFGTSGSQGAMASAGDISPSGDRFAVLTYENILVWPRAATLTATFAATPKSVAWTKEKQTEGLTFSADGKSLILAGEQVTSIYEAQANCP